MSEELEPATRPGAAGHPRVPEARWEAVRQNEERLQQLFDLNLAGIYRTAWDGTILECNGAFATMLAGCTPAELEGRSIEPFYQQASDRAYLLRALEHNRALSAREIPMRRADGVPVWILATAMRVSGEAGAREIEGTIVDITASKQATDALLESEARFRSVIHTAGSPIVCTDVAQRITEFNPAAERVFGLLRATVLGLSYPALFPASLRGKVSEDFARVASGSAIADFENVIERPDGRVTVVLWNIQPLRDADGRPRGVVAVGQDITARQRAEESRLRQARYLRALTDVDRAILALQPPEAIAGAVLRHMGALLPWRGAAVVTFDAGAGEARLLAFVGDPGCALPSVRPLRRDELAPAADDTPAPKASPHLLELPLAVHGASIGVLLVHQPAGPRPLPASELELARQVADRLAVALHNWTLFQREGDARRRLEAVSSRLVDVQETERRLLARELHDEVGQSLTALKLQLELAAHRAETGSLERAGAVVNDLIEQVRNLSLELRPAILDDFGLLPALLWHVERYGRLTGVRVRLEHEGLDGRFPQAIETAAYRIVQEALTNVARHAHAREVRVSVRATSAGIGIEIEDGGDGFEPARPPAQPSTGLSGMKERATMLGGDVTVVSAPGQGTLIRASFPLERPAGRAAEAGVRLT